MNWKPLMLKCFLYPRVNVLTKTRNSRVGKPSTPAEQPQKPSPVRSPFLDAPPAHRKVEHYFRTFNVAPRTSSAHAAVITDGRRTPNVRDNRRLRQRRPDPIEPRKRRIGVMPVRGVHDPVTYFAIGRKILRPIGSIIEKIGGRFVL
ncbi:hypothetical protein I552_0120 [Mycobacterium xenopi 3993]|nr:hypothetical protein I552_0120 [Mycobacterium xenopi 3993]